MVDSRYLLQHLVDDERPEGSVNEALQQIAFSDLILLNKTDLVSEEQKQVVLSTLRRVNGTARLVEVQLNDPNKRPGVETLLDINSFSINRALEVSAHSWVMYVAALSAKSVLYVTYPSSRGQCPHS